MIAHSQDSQSMEARDPSQASFTLGDVPLPIAEREGGEDVLRQSEPLVCPGLFYATPAQDGAIYRIRTPAGILTSQQASVVAHFAEQMGDGYLQITNRANLQIRSVHTVAPPPMLSTFQDVGLAAAMSGVDHLRNIMASPTAGIDPQSLIDTRPLVTALDHTIVQHEEFAGLPAKFSVGFDGGEVVSVRHHPNDIWLVATADHRPGAGEHLPASFRLLFNAGQGQELDTGLLVRPEECVPLVVAIAQVYLTHVEHSSPPATGKKPRLRQVIAQQGINRVSGTATANPALYAAPSPCGGGTVSRRSSPFSAYRCAPSTAARSLVPWCGRSSRSTGNPTAPRAGRPRAGIRQWHCYASHPGKMC